jgi:hypothetical protein
MEIALEQKVSLYVKWFHWILTKINRLVEMNMDRWKNSEFTGLVNRD